MGKIDMKDIITEKVKKIIDFELEGKLYKHRFSHIKIKNRKGTIYKNIVIIPKV